MRPWPPSGEAREHAGPAQAPAGLDSELVLCQLCSRHEGRVSSPSRGAAVGRLCQQPSVPGAGGAAAGAALSSGSRRGDRHI